MTTLEYDEVEMRIVTPSGEFYALDMDINRNRFKQVDLLEGKFIPSVGANEPTANTRVNVDVNGRRLFTGRISQVKKNNSDDGTEDKGSYQFNVINGMNTYINEKINLDFTDPTPVSKIAEEAAGGYGIPTEINPTNNIQIRMERNNASISDILDTLAKKSDSVWMIDPYNVLKFGDPNVQEHQLEWVTGTSAGKQTPPYMSVRVVGDSIVSKEGWDKRYMTGDKRVVSEWHIEQQNNGNYKVSQGIGEKPIFPYKSKEIQTQEQADNIGQSLAKDLAKQSQGGWINVVGREDIDPLDFVRMPDFMGGETYLVSGTIHTMTDSDGYKTRIVCGGVQ